MTKDWTKLRYPFFLLCSFPLFLYFFEPFYVFHTFPPTLHCFKYKHGDANSFKRTDSLFLVSPLLHLLHFFPCCIVSKISTEMLLPFDWGINHGGLSRRAGSRFDPEPCGTLPGVRRLLLATRCRCPWIFIDFCLGSGASSLTKSVIDFSNALLSALSASRTGGHPALLLRGQCALTQDFRARIF